MPSRVKDFLARAAGPKLLGDDFKPWWISSMRGEPHPEDPDLHGLDILMGDPASGIHTKMPRLPDIASPRRLAAEPAMAPSLDEALSTDAEMSAPPTLAKPRSAKKTLSRPMRRGR